MKLEQWFPTPIWYGVYENIRETQYTSAIKYCNELATNHPGRTQSNIGGWQSDNLYYVNLIDTPLQIYIDEIRPRVKAALLELGVKSNYDIFNIWININYKGCRNVLHNHAGASLSGVFYLTENNSEIVFRRDPDINTYCLESMDSDKDTFLSSDIVKYTPQQGQYMIFPPWLKHEVSTNNDDNERISIAFNVKKVYD